MTDRPHIYTTRVRYADTDQMGIAHHARYYEWFESARTDLIRACGISYRDLEQKGFLLPVLETYCRYVYPVHYDDEIEIHTSVESMNRLKMKIGYALYVKNDKRLHSRGYTAHCFMNPEGRPVRADSEIQNYFKLYM